MIKLLNLVRKKLSVIEKKIPEPVVQMYLNLGFKPLGLIPNSMESDIESAHYGLAMLKE